MDKVLGFEPSDVGPIPAGGTYIYIVIERVIKPVVLRTGIDPVHN